MKTKINEIFSSIQGEGAYVGYKQLFIRFCGCNLNCEYCDTEFNQGVEYTPVELFEKITSEYDLSTFHSISLTGGEPLVSADFLAEFLHKINHITKIYLETNGTLADEFSKVKPYIDIISADIKLKSSTGLDTMNLHEKFFENCKDVENFAKIVFDNNITDDEITRCCELAQKYNLPLILQPKMNGNNMSVSSEFCEDILDKFLEKYYNVRLIPQVHKFLNVR
jgi:organic radical activating enzyme